MRKRHLDAKPRPRLDLDLLVQAAIALLDEEGLDGLTTRRLAARLGVQSPALYWYVRDKDELLDLVAESICAMALEPMAALVANPSLGWRERLESLLRLYRTVLYSHRDAPRLLAERSPVGPNRLLPSDAMVGFLLEAGFREAEAASLSLFLGDYVISIVSEELRLTAPSAEPNRERFATALAERPEDYPNLLRVAPHLAAIRSEELFEVGLGVLLDGLKRRLEALQAVQ